MTTAKNAALIMAVAVALFGGRISYENFEASTDGGFSSLVECVNDYLNQDQNREQREQLFERYIDSLDLQSVENINNIVDEEEMAEDGDDAELNADMDE